MLPFADATAPSEIDVLQTTYSKLFGRVSFTLLAIIVLVIGTLWLYRRFSHQGYRASNQLRSIKILEKRALSPKSVLYLVEVGGKPFVISESQLEVRFLQNIDWKNDLPPGEESFSPK